MLASKTPAKLVLLIDGAVILAFLIIFYRVSPGFDIAIVGISLMVFYLYFVFSALKTQIIYNGIKTHLTIELAFGIFYFLLFFMPYQQHVLGIADYGLSKFLLQTYEDGANQAIVLAVIGYVGFCAGVRIGDSKRTMPSTCEEERDEQYDLFDRILTGLLAGVLAIFLGAGLESADTGRYADIAAGGAVADGIYVIIVMLCLMICARAITRLAKGRVLSISNMLGLTIVAIWSIRILVSGDRNNFFLIAIGLTGGIATFLFRIRWPVIIVGVLLAMTLYKTVEAVRMAQNPSIADLIDALLSDGAPDEPGGSSFGNTTATLRATFDIVPDREPYGYGRYKLIGFAGVIPLIRGVVLRPEAYFTNTSELLTDYMIGPDAGWSVGTNLLSDIYIDFGLFGVPALMIVVGFVVALTKKSVENKNVTTPNVTMYVFVLSTFAEMPRYTMDFPVRIVAWGLIIIWFYRSFFLSRIASVRVASLTHSRTDSQKNAGGGRGTP